MNGDNLEKLNDCQTEIRKIKEWINKNNLDSNIKYLVSYAVIKACGTIEIVFKDFICDFLSYGAIDETKVFLQKKIIDASFNPSTGQISSLFEKLNPKWKEQFESKLKGSQEKGDLNSLVTLRNTFSHGSSITTSMDDIERYLESGIKILDIIENIVLGENNGNI